MGRPWDQQGRSFFMDADDKHKACFGCGSANSHGLGLKVTHVDGVVRAEFVGRSEHQGFKGQLHGGIVTAALDETMGYAVGHAAGAIAFTAEIVVRFKSPAPIAVGLLVEAKIESLKGRMVMASAELSVAGEGRIIATAKGKFLQPGAKKQSLPD